MQEPYVHYGLRDDWSTAGYPDGHHPAQSIISDLYRRRPAD